MTQYIFNSGTTLNVTSIPEFANLNTQQLPMEEIRILVDTSVARTVILPYSTLFPVRNVKISILDNTGQAATNNITVQASAGSPDDTINGVAAFALNTNYQFARFEILADNKYFSLSQSSAPNWVKVTKTYADFATAATTNVVPIFVQKAKQCVLKCVAHNPVEFIGGSLSSYTFQVGYLNPFYNNYIQAINVFNAIKTSQPDASQSGAVSFTADTTVYCKLVSVGDNLDAATQGTIDLYILLSTIDIY